jgi:kinesin family member 6/9
MTGSSTQFKYRGILPRAITQIYALTGNKFDQAITIRVSYSEIYNEKIRDLLVTNNDITAVEQNL